MVAGLAGDLFVAIALLAGYVWLALLSLRVRALHRRLALHACPDPQPIATTPARSGRPITVAELLDREQRPDRA